MGQLVMEYRSASPFGFAILTTTALMAISSCSSDWRDLPPVNQEEFITEHEDWRSNREQGLVTPPGGPVLWSGLFNLPQGETAFGSDPTLPIVLPAEDSPALAGTLVRQGQDVHLEPASDGNVYLQDGPPIEETTILENDRSGNTTYLSLGSLGMRVHSEPGTDRLWLRVWDTDLPERETFRLPEYFALSTEWLVSARLDRYPELRSIPLADITGGMIEQDAIGELVFRKADREHRLIAFGNEQSRSYFVSLWDSTAITETYQAGRYMRVPAAGEDGWTTIDFNRSYNAPCVFTAFSVCSLPPLENRLDLAVTAGEKRPEKPAY